MSMHYTHRSLSGKPAEDYCIRTVLRLMLGADQRLGIPCLECLSHVALNRDSSCTHPRQLASGVYGRLDPSSLDYMSLVVVVVIVAITMERTL
jgi:hypothetical protein